MLPEERTLVYEVVEKMCLLIDKGNECDGKKGQICQQTNTENVCSLLARQHPKEK